MTGLAQLAVENERKLVRKDFNKTTKNMTLTK